MQNWFIYRNIYKGEPELKTILALCVPLLLVGFKNKLFDWKFPLCKILINFQLYSYFYEHLLFQFSIILSESHKASEQKIDGNAVTRSILLEFQVFKNEIPLKLKNNVSSFSDILWSKQNWASYSVSVVFCFGILDQMLGDLNKV